MTDELKDKTDMDQIQKLLSQIEGLTAEKKAIKKTLTKTKANKTRAETELRAALERIKLLQENYDNKNTNKDKDTVYNRVKELEALLQAKEEMLQIALTKNDVVDDVALESLKEKHTTIEKNFKEETDKLKSELEKKSSSMIDYKAKVEVHRLENEKLKLDFEKIHIEKRDFNARLSELQVKYNEAKASNEDKKLKLNKIKKKYQDAALARAEIQSSLELIRTEFEDTKDTLLATETKLEEEEKNREMVQEELTVYRTKDIKSIQKQHELESELSQLHSTHDQLKTAHESLEIKFSTINQRVEEISLNESKLMKDISGAKQAYKDQALEHKIASRRSVQLIKDLKSQLAKSKKKNEEMTEKVTILESKHSTAVSNNNYNNGTIPSASTTSSSIVEKNKNNKDAISVDEEERKSISSDEQEGIMKALATRLEMLLTENSVVREKVKFLEETVQILTLELEEKNNQLISKI